MMHVVTIGAGHGHPAPNAAEYGKRCIEHRNSHHNDRHCQNQRSRGLQRAYGRYSGYGEPQEHGAGVAHEYLSRVEVVAKETQRTAGEGERQHYQPGLVVSQRRRRHGQRTNGRHPGRQAVKPVDEVDDVHEGNNPHDGDGN